MFCVYKLDIFCCGVMLKKSKNQIQIEGLGYGIRVYLLLLIPNFETKFSIQYLVTTIDIVIILLAGSVITWSRDLLSLLKNLQS